MFAFCFSSVLRFLCFRPAVLSVRCFLILRLARSFVGAWWCIWRGLDRSERLRLDYFFGVVIHNLSCMILLILCFFTPQSGLFGQDWLKTDPCVNLMQRFGFVMSTTLTRRSNFAVIRDNRNWRILLYIGWHPGANLNGNVSAPAPHRILPDITTTTPNHTQEGWKTTPWYTSSVKSTRCTCISGRQRNSSRWARNFRVFQCKTTRGLSYAWTRCIFSYLSWSGNSWPNKKGYKRSSTRSRCYTSGRFIGFGSERIVMAAVGYRSGGRC